MIIIMDELLVIKVIFIFSMLGSAAIAGFIPLYTKSLYNSPRLISVGNCFAAGIFLLVGIVHLLPDAQEAFDESLSPNSMPIGYVIAGGGYAMMVFIESILFPAHSHSHGPDHTHPLPNSKSNKDLSIDLSQNPSLSMHFEEVSTPHRCGYEKEDFFAKSLPQKLTVSALPGAILSCALVVHSVFEGIACGLLEDESGVITLSAAILIHNIPAALALAIKLKGVKKWIACVLMMAFATSSPLGVAIGISLTNLAYPAVKGTFLAISSGTFVYISCTEIMAEEMAKPESKGWKYFGFLVGYIPLALVSVFIAD